MPDTRPRYVFVLGSVLSGLGKGIVTCSIGVALQARQRKVHIVKIDPYLNLDAGTMNPMEHGETFVTADGGELDVDFGHYERFLGLEVSKEQNITTGQIYYNVILKERKGEYLGQTVQIVPHIINEIIGRLEEQREKYSPDIMIVEVGGTIGDIESEPFLEAVRQMRRNRDKFVVSTVLLTYVPFPQHLQEHKTKPAQHSVRELRASGISPDLIICRSEVPIVQKALEKISNFGNVPDRAVLQLPDLDNVYKAPLTLEKQGLGSLLREYLDLEAREQTPDFSKFENLSKRLNSLKGKIVIGVPGKYTQLQDSYISVTEALKHAAWMEGYDVELRLISTEEFENDENKIKILEDVDGILIPGGFGDRGTEGKIRAIRFARETGKPFLGICLGFQLAVVEYCRNVLGYSDAHSTEMTTETNFPIVDLLPDQKNIDQLGGTMRLGNYEITLEPDSMLANLYGSTKIIERHRHRYEINPGLKDKISGNLKFTGFWNTLAETLELVGHPYFVGTQFHPEFKSTPWKPSPPYLGFIKAVIAHSR